jgi:hypothetical protein
MTERKNQPKQRLRKQPRMRRVYSATATPMPDMSMSKTVRKRKRRNSRQRFQRPVSGAKAVILNTRWISLAVMVVCAYALFLIGGDDRFYLNYIPVEGATSIEINHIVAESDLAGRHIFATDPQEAADDIGSMGGIVTATVTLHWPNDVMIRIREKPPLATWQEGEQTYWIDEDGQLSAARAQTVGLLNIVSEIPLASAAEDETILDEEEAAVEAEQGTTADEIPEDASTEEVESEEPAQEPGSQAAFVPAPVPTASAIRTAAAGGPISAPAVICNRNWLFTRRLWRTCLNVESGLSISASPTSTSRTTGRFRRSGVVVWKILFSE